MKIQTALFAFVFISLLCINNTSHAQINFSLGKTVDDPDLVFKWIIDEDPLSILMLTTTEYAHQSSSIYLKRYNRQTYDLENTEKMTAPLKDSLLPHFRGFQKIKDNYYVFSSRYYKKTDVNMLCAHRIDRNGNPVGEMIDLDVVNNVTSNVVGFFGVTASKNDNAILTYRNKNLNIDDPVKFTLKVFDADLKLKWEKTVDVPEYKDEDFTIRDGMVDDNGNVFIKVFVKTTDDERKLHKKIFFKYVILSFTAENGEMTWHEIPIPATGEYSNVAFDINDRQELVVSGVYCVSRSYSSPMTGTVFMKFDFGNPKPKTIKMTNLSDSFLRSWIEEPNPLKSKFLQNIHTTKVYVLPDGGLITVFERTQFPGQLRREDQLMIVRYDAEGTVLWEKVILKLQPGNNFGERYFSHKSFFDGEKIYFIYNDAPGNDTITKIEKIKPVDYVGNGKIVVKSISLDGELKTERWNWPKQSPVLFSHHFWFEISDNLFYFIPLENGDCGNSDGKKCQYFGRISWDPPSVK